MKKILLSLFIAVFSIAGFSFTAVYHNPPLPLCTALLKVMKEEPSEFATLKGTVVSETADVKTYNSKIVFEGWVSSEYSNSEGAISIDVQSLSTTKAKAQELFKTTAKQLAGCLEMQGVSLQAKGVDELLIFTKSKCDVALMLVTKEDKSFVMISISRES
jgi:hypothetical protein